MSLYLEAKAQLPLRAPTIASAWCQTSSLLAVSAEGGHVWILNEEGERIDTIELGAAKFSLDIVALAWHPSRPVLALGRSDGCVSVWVEGEHSKMDDPSQHKCCITLLEWSPEGARLISADKSGKISVWVSGNNGFSPGCTYQRNDEPTHIVFRTVPDCESKGGASFLVGGRTGMIGHANDSSACVDVFNVEAPVAALCYHEATDQVVVLTKRTFLFQWKCSSPDKWEQVMKVKLSVAVDAVISDAIWAGGGVLVAVTGEPLLRVYDLVEGENYTLPLDMAAQGASEHGDRAVSACFNNRNGRLAAGSRDGRVFIWQYAPAIFDSAGAGADNWEPLPGLKLGAGVKRVSWGGGKSVGVMTADGASVLNESVMANACSNGLAVLQASASMLHVQQVPRGGPEVIVPSISVKGVVTNGKQTVLWDGKIVQVYEAGEKELESVQAKTSSFSANITALVVSGDSIYMLERHQPHVIKATNFAGTTKCQLTFTEQQGPVTMLSINNGFLVAASSTGTIRIWNVSRREPKPIGNQVAFHRETILWQAISGNDSPPPTSPDTPKGDIISVRVNNAGQRLSLIASMKLSNGLYVPDSRLYVYDVENDKWSSHDFGMRCPTVHHWDSQEPRLLAVQTGLGSNARKEALLEGLNIDEAPEVSIFVSTKDHAIVLQDSFILEDRHSDLISIAVPYVYYASRASATEANDASTKLCHQVMRDFKGMEEIDAVSRSAVLDFSFFLTIGEMDAAYQAVKQITSQAVWENMAHMCIKTKRLDVAEICVGHMGDARTAEALRRSKDEKELDARVGILAVHLGMYSDAARLFKECKRFDLLSELMQAQGCWEEALELVERHERIGLRTLHFNHGKYLETVGDVRSAIDSFEHAGAQAQEVPRMLHARGMTSELEEYVMSKDDHDLHNWWGQYCESNDNLADALVAYTKAGNHLARVRILCFQAEYPAALQLVEDTSDPAATYHLAKQLEAAGELKDAVQLYARTGSASHAIRVARRCGEADGELMGLASSATNPKAMMEAASYFEEHRQFDKAVELFSRAGDTSRALQLCFDAQLFSSLSRLVDSMSAETTLQNPMDPKILSRCASFFLEHQQFDQAVMLYIKSGETQLGLDLCVQHNILITESMAETMTPDQESATTGMTPDQAERHNANRTDLLFKLAKACQMQGQYHLACKKFTQAGDKLKAMKALIKSGDTDKISFFANVSRHREIYVMAANYLQTLDWHNDQAIMKSIIQYYTKARDLLALSGFYEACAQVEIDDYRDYEKAFSALKESLKYMIKARAPDKEERLQVLQQRIFLVEKFVHARKLVKTDPDQMIQICQQLLAQADLENGIRVGDVFALMIEYSHAKGDMNQAYLLVEQMRNRHIILSPYLDREMIESIYRAVGMEPVFEDGAEEDPDGMEEDIVTEE